MAPLKTIESFFLHFELPCRTMYCLHTSDMEDCAPGTSVPDFQSILWSASGTPIQFLAIFYYEERMKIQNPFFKKDLERERNPFKKDFPYDC